MAGTRTVPVTILMQLLPLTFAREAPARPAWQVPPPGVHPRLVFSSRELPALRAKLNTPRGRRLFEAVQATADAWVLRVGGHVDTYLKDLESQVAKSKESGKPVQVVSHGPWEIALIATENAALVYAITSEQKYGEAARRVLVNVLPYTTGEALRPAALIYDWCYPLLAESDRTLVRKEIARLAEEVLQQLYAQPFSLGPCPVNQAIYWGMLMGSYLGIGALAIEGEPQFQQKWMDEARRCVEKSMLRFLDEEGCHENGPAYTDYGFSNCSFYLEALRLRGTNWAQHPRLSKLPIWLTYLMLPGAPGVAPQLLPVGNSNFGVLTGQDGICWLQHAMPENRWMNNVYRFSMSPANFNGYIRAVGALFLWDRPFLPPPDFATLPRTKWFSDGGVFMRTGWGFQDIVFWLKTQQHRCTPGKHDDYGSFYLHAYGEPFAVEGMGKVESSAVHNLVFIDGKCMDRGSYDVMPSAPLLDLVTGDFASAALVDQKTSYKGVKVRSPR